MVKQLAKLNSNVQNTLTEQASEVSQNLNSLQTIVKFHRQSIDHRDANEWLCCRVNNETNLNEAAVSMSFHSHWKY